MKPFRVEFSDNGSTRRQSFRANGPGQAFFKCKEAHPDAELKCAVLRGVGFMRRTSIRYDAPKNQSMPSKPKPNPAIQEVMPFFNNEALSRRKL